MGKMTMTEIQERQIAIWDELDEMENKSREANNGDIVFSDEDAAKYDALVRESAGLTAKAKALDAASGSKSMNNRENRSEKLRSLLRDCKEKRESYSEELQVRDATTTILKDPATGNETANLEASGAVPLTIRELIDTKVPGLELPDDLRLLTGVVGNEVWPYAIDDVEFTVAGEVEPITEQAINFAKLNATPERVAAAIAVSNRAIDNAAFDLLGFVLYKFQKGLAKFAALHVYSHCEFTHALKSPFAAVDVVELTVDENIGKNIAKEIAAMWDLGFEGEPELVMDKQTETSLRFTKAIPGQVGDRTVIEDGRCVGYKYKVSPFINYALDGNTPKPDGDHYIGIGHWGYLAYEQHGEVRFTVDAQSAEVAKRNTTVLVLNTELSLTELSSKVNGNTSGKPQAFKLIKLVEE